MSWHLRIAGKDREALRIRVIAERMPAEVEKELLARIESIPLAIGQCLMVFAQGHIDMHNGARTGPYVGADTLYFQVYAVPFLDTPAETAGDPVQSGKVGDGG